MKEYYWMYLLEEKYDRKHRTEVLSLVSEVIEDLEDASAFSEAVQTNYYCDTAVLIPSCKGYIVKADNVPKRLIQANFRKEKGGYILASYKYITRSLIRKEEFWKRMKRRNK